MTTSLFYYIIILLSVNFDYSLVKKDRINTFVVVMKSWVMLFCGLIVLFYDLWFKRFHGQSYSLFANSFSKENLEIRIDLILFKHFKSWESNYQCNSLIIQLALTCFSITKLGMQPHFRCLLFKTFATMSKDSIWTSFDPQVFCSKILNILRLPTPKVRIHLRMFKLIFSHFFTLVKMCFNPMTFC